MKNAIKGVAAFLLIIGGIAGIFTETGIARLSGVLLAFAGILCLPPVYPKLEQAIQRPIARSIKYLSGITRNNI